MTVQPQINRESRRLAADALGVGLKPQHYAEILAARPNVGFFEIHAENYMSAGGPPHRWLSAIAEIYPLSVHGVGLSLGSAEKLDHERLARLSRVVSLYRPALVSEHLAWCDFAGRAFPDLLPLLYDEANCRRVAEKIDATQTALGRTILVENPATYLRFAGDFLGETQFLDELAQKSGCGLLLDVNNVHVSAVNHGFAAEKYLDAFPMRHVGEIHLAGFARANDAHGDFLIDDHGAPVSDEVWALYAHVIRIGGLRPTLVEWDNGVPEWQVLYGETQKAAAVCAGARSDPFSPWGKRGSEGPDEGDSRAQTGSPSSHLLPPKGVQPNAHLPAGFGEEATSGWLELQAQFAAALANPAQPVPNLFTPCDTSTRFAVYRNNSAVAAINALKEQFPTVLSLVGDEAFSCLARAFAAKFPPRSPTLGDYGAEFPDFVEKFLASGDARIPYLPDMARLDWARIKALRAEEAVPIETASLAALDAGRLAEAKIVLHPSLALVASDWPLLAICDADQAPVEDWRGETALVLRPQADLICLACPPGPAALLRAWLDGKTLGEAALAASAADETFDFGKTLVELTRLGAIVAFNQ